jgi:lipid-binding SYLF domain-containing protein
MENLYRMHARNKVYTSEKKKYNKLDRTSMEGMIYNGNLILDYALKAPLREEKRRDLGKDIPSVLFRECEGILLLNVLEAACLISANVGTGILMAHNKQDDTWSAPSAIGLTGVGWGLQGGIAKKDVVVFIMDEESMNALTGDDMQLKFGPQASITIGDAGREVQGAFHASKNGLAATVAFAYSKGLLFGFSLQGNIVAPRTACNMNFYGCTTTSREILFDKKVPANKGIEDLHRKLQMLVERSVKKMSVTAQTQTEEESANEYEIIVSPNKEIQKKEDPPGLEQESDSEDDMEFIDPPAYKNYDAEEEDMEFIVSSEAIDMEMNPPAYKNDDADEEDMEFVVSSEAIEMEMKSAGVL